MGNRPKSDASSLSKLKEELQIIQKSEQDKLKGCKGTGIWNTACGDIVPQ